MEVNQEVSGMIDDLVRVSLGATLRDEREKKGLSTRDVADKLRLMVYQIEAIEGEDFSSFKADIFVKSYLRNYAKLVGLDAAPLLLIYKNQYQIEQKTPVMKRPSPVHMPCKKRYLGVVAAIVVLLLLWLLSASDEKETNVINSDLGMQLPEEDVVETADGLLLQNKAEYNGLLVSNVDGLSDSENNSLASSDVSSSAVDNAVVQIASIIAEVDEFQPAHLLELNFTGECWVEIKDAEGQTLVADLKKSGDKVQVEGLAPFNVLLGYAPVVELLYNGEAVNIKTNSRSQAARLVVGRS